MNNPKNRNRPHAIARIYEAASSLVMPPLAPLLQVFTDQKAAINEKRSELTRKMEDVRIEGFEAATRLMIPSVERLEKDQSCYFERINNQGGK